MKRLYALLLIFGTVLSLTAQTPAQRINRSLFTGTTVDMEATNDTVRYYAFGKPGNIIVSGDYDEVMNKLSEMKQFTRTCKWGDKIHISEHLSIERRGLIGPRAYIITNDSVGTRIRTGFNSISESHHAVWVHRPTNADEKARARKAARDAENNQNPEGQPFDFPFGGFGGFGGPF